MTTTNTVALRVSLHHGARESLLVVSNGNVADDFSTILPVAGWTARDFADRFLAASGVRRTSEWQRDPWGFLTADAEGEE